MPVVGPLLLDVALLGVGEALLVGIGIVRNRRQALRFCGLAFVVGWCVVGALLSYALMVGATLALWEVLVLVALPAAAGVLLARRRGNSEVELDEVTARRSRIGWAAGLVLAGYMALLGLHAALAGSPIAWDAWAFWIPRAKAIFFFHGLHPGLAGGFASFAHPEYPPLVPAFDAAVFRVAGSADPLLLPFQDWLLAVAFLAAAAALLYRRVPPPVLWSSLLVLALAPSFGSFIGTGLGDPPLGRLFALAGVAAALWLVERDGRLLALLGILLVGCALAKGEGALLGVLLVLALLGAALLERPRRVRSLLVVLPIPILAAVPWQLWLKAEHVVYSPDYRLRSVLHPGYLTARSGRLGTALADLPGYALSLEHWLLIVPLALLLAVLLLRRRASLGVLVLAVLAFAYLGLAGVYWISTLPLDWYISTSADRVSSSLVLLCGALAPLLAAELLRAPEPR